MPPSLPPISDRSEYLVVGIDRGSTGIVKRPARFYGIDLLLGNETNEDLAERYGESEREFYIVPLGGEPRSAFDA